MMPLTKEDFIGKRFGMLIAEQMFRDGSVPKVECLCDCGEVKIVNAYSLKKGDVKSCGCLRSITFNKTFTKHGNAKSGRTKEYRAWRGMVARCNGNCSQEYYLEKGITVSPEWISDFPAFLSHVGKAPTSRHTIDRIDNGLGYQPGNVRWATPKEQARNRDNGVYVIVDGARMLLVEASEKYLISASVVRNRLAAGWSDEAAVKTPKQFQRTASRPVERRT